MTCSYLRLSVSHQLLPNCPVGYERNALGICVPIVSPDPNGGDSDGNETDTEQEIGQKNVGSDESTNNNCALNSFDTTAAATVACPVTSGLVAR